MEHIGSAGVIAINTKAVCGFLEKNGKIYKSAHSLRNALANGIVPAKSLNGSWVYNKEVLTK